MGRSGTALTVVDELIDFGRILSLPSAADSATTIERFLTLTNSDPVHACPITFRCAAPELVLTDTVIPPATTVRVPLRFTPKRCAL